jgi:protein phosphatase
MATVPASQSLPDIRAELDHALAIGDSEVQSAGVERAMPGMGTTLTLAYVAFPRLYVSHVGDSRCYLFRNNALSRLTTDHTLAEQLRQSGRPAGVSQWDHVLWNALGGGEAGVKPEIHRVILEPGDAILLSSDGLTKHVPDETIAALLGQMSDATTACRQLVDAANAGGGSDNVTVVVARFGRRVVR